MDFPVLRSPWQCNHQLVVFAHFCHSQLSVLENDPAGTWKRASEAPLNAKTVPSFNMFKAPMSHATYPGVEIYWLWTYLVSWGWRKYIKISIYKSFHTHCLLIWLTSYILLYAIANTLPFFCFYCLVKWCVTLQTGQQSHSLRWWLANFRCNSSWASQLQYVTVANRHL